MLDFSMLRHRASVTRNTNPVVTIVNEGSALVVDTSLANGVATSTGAAGEQFAGISITTQVDPAQLPQYDQLVVDAAGHVVTTYVPLAGTIFAQDVTAAANLVVDAAGTAAAAGHISQVSTGSQTLQTATAAATHTLLVGYRYSPTVQVAQWLQGDQLPGNNISRQLNTVGVLVSGDVYTSEFDTSADWTAAALYVVLGANGLFTTTATAANALPGVRVLSRPGYGNSFLGLSIGFNG